MRSGLLPLALLAVLPWALGSGCAKSGLADPAVARAAPTATSVAQVHWVGTKTLTSEANAARLRSIIALPQANALGQQLVAKLAQAPWRNAATGVTNPASVQLQALLRTVFANEGYLEVHSDQTVLAVRLSDSDRALWQSSLPSVLKAWPGVKPGTQDGTWILSHSGEPRLIRHVRHGDWVVLSWAPAKGELGQKIGERVSRGATPFKSGPTNSWLEASADLARLLPMLGLGSATTSYPIMSLTAVGEGEYVRTDAKFTFSSPLRLTLDPWNIPTNTIHEPLVNFTAARGLRTPLAGLPFFQQFKPDALPNQAYGWGLSVGPMFSQVALPLANPSSWMDQVGPKLEAYINPWLKEQKVNVQAKWEADKRSVSWVPVPLVNPTLQSWSSPAGEMLLGRLGPLPAPRGDPPPPELLHRVVSTPNLVYYHWELTEPRLAHWLFLSQSARVAFDRAQIDGNSPILNFLLAAKSQMGNTVTDVRLTNPNTLTLLRKSHSGFTALEWHLIGDWVESPQFPRSLHSFLKHGSGLPTYRDFMNPGPPPANAPGRK